MPSPSEFERLFLLEVFVDTVYVKNSSVNDDDSSLCVSFQFLNYPVMLVCEEDFAPKTKSLSKGTNVVFKSGKSCLFSLRTDQSNSLPPEFDLIIKVIQNMKKNSETGKALVADTVVKLGSSFTSLMKNSVNTTTPAAYVKQDTFPLKDRNGEQVGNLAAFVRLSCFGKLIVTQFQLAGDDNKNYMFKGTDPKKIFPDDDSFARPIGSLQPDEFEDSEEELPGDIPYKDIFSFPEESDEEVGGENSEEDGEEEGGGGEWGPQKVDEGRAIQEKDTKHEQDKKESDTGEKEEDYKEIGAEINGNSITIRVLKKAKRAKKSVKSIEEVTQVPPSPAHPELPTPTPLCSCQQFLSRCFPCPLTCQPAPTSPCFPTSQGGPQVGNYTQMQGMNMLQCPKEDCPLGLYNVNPQQIQSPQMDLEPGTVAMKGDQVIFQMSNRPVGEPISEKEKKLANSIYYKLASGEAGKEVMKNTVQISPQNPGEPFNTAICTGGGPVSGLPIDNKQDMFLLKVQQNSDAVDTKSKLEMELRTPKTTEPKPETNTKNTQYIVTDFPAPEKKSITDKGKKKKK